MNVELDLEEVLEAMQQMLAERDREIAQLRAVVRKLLAMMPSESEPT